MKKLRLKALELKAFEILTREQLRSEITGGSTTSQTSTIGGSSSLNAGHCGHGISCANKSQLQPCGSTDHCFCQYVSGPDYTLYCRSAW